VVFGTNTYEVTGASGGRTMHEELVGIEVPLPETWEPLIADVWGVVNVVVMDGGIEGQVLDVVLR